MKIAFDVHGVIDAYPEIIYPMIKLLQKMGNEICIVSGPSKLLLFKELEKIKFYDIIKNHEVEIYSVVDFLIDSGVKMWKDDKGNPWANEEDWWDSKAKICQKHEIDFIIDDSEKYRSAFDLIDCTFIHIDELI